MAIKKNSRINKIIKETEKFPRVMKYPMRKKDEKVAQYILIGAALHPLIKFSLVTLGGLFVSLLISQCMRKLLFSRKMRRST